MKTTRLYIQALALVLACIPNSRAGSPVAFGAWGEPEALTIAAEAGTREVLRRTIRTGRTFPIDWVASADTQSVWVGYGREKYFDLNGSIWSAHSEHYWLELVPPRALEAGQDPVGFANQWIADLIEGRTSWGYQSMGIVQFDLARIFGREALRDVNTDTEGTGLTIRGIDVDKEKARFTLGVLNGNVFQLTFSRAWELLEARKNGTPLTPLADGRIPSRRNPWSQR